MTREAFLEWAERQERPYEFNGREPVPMNGGNVGHYVIATNISSELSQRLKGGKCTAISAGAGVATIGNAVRFPDAVVTCTAFKLNDRLVPNPVIVFEVGSPSSVRNDWVVKLQEYAAVPSILRYVILEQDSVAAGVFSRTSGDAGWTVAAVTADQALSLPEISVEIPLRELYAGLDLPA